MQRCAEEEITFAIPVLQKETKAAVSKESFPVVGDLDLAFLDRDIGEKNVAEENELNDIHVARTIDAINDADAVAAPEEIAEVVSTMENPRLTSVDDSGSDEEVINIFGPIEVPKSVSVPPVVAARPRQARCGLIHRHAKGQNHTDLRTTHQTCWVLDDQWDGKLSTRASPGPYVYVHRDFDLIPKLGYHSPVFCRPSHTWPHFGEAQHRLALS